MPFYERTLTNASRIASSTNRIKGTAFRTDHTRISSSKLRGTRVASWTIGSSRFAFGGMP
jgi:hypothetical protein